MKFRYNGTLDDFVKNYSDAKDRFNKENPSKHFSLVTYIRAGKIEIGVEKGKNGGSYWFISPLTEKDGYIELEGDIVPDADMKMRWYDWIIFGLVFVITLIPMLFACIFTRSTPFSSKKKRAKRLRTYLCKYLGCEEIKE